MSRESGGSTPAAMPSGAAPDAGREPPPSVLETLYLLVRAMRPRQWTKNLILFAALIFSKNLFDVALLARASAAFAVFCLLSGVVYTLNDLLDLKADRLHPVKQKRPLASGRLRVRTGILGAASVLFVALVAATAVGPRFWFISVGFLVFNLAYTVVLKTVVIVDVISISISFLIRAIAGVIALNTAETHLTISPWLLVVTFFLSFFLGLCKRFHEFTAMLDPGQHRSTLTAYSEELLNQLINVAATGTLISYSIYTIWPDTVSHFGTDKLMYTIPIVVAGVTRYLFLVYRRNLGGDPSEVLLNERPLLATVLIWFVSVAVVIYAT